MLLTKKRTTKSNEENEIITKWTSAMRSCEKEKQRDIQEHVNKLIEKAKVALDEYEQKTANGATLVLEKEHAKQAEKEQKKQKEEPKKQKYYIKKPIEEVIGMAAVQIARDIGARCVISIERKGLNLAEREHIDVQVSIFKQDGVGDFRKTEYQTKMHKVMSGSIVPIKELLMEAINKKFIQKGDRIVCVEDESLGMGYKGLLFVFDVDQVFFDISNLNLASNVNPEVMEAIINLSLEMAKEGREGRKIGTSFIIGKKEEIAPFIKQMIINPFSGYPEEFRKITDPNIKETIKNFAQLDGVFIIDDAGTIITAGAYLNVDVTAADLPAGYGTRHRCSAAITKTTNSVAVVISESGGLISIFKNGRLAMKLP